MIPISRNSHYYCFELNQAGVLIFVFLLLPRGPQFRILNQIQNKLLSLGSQLRKNAPEMAKRHQKNKGPQNCQKRTKNKVTAGTRQLTLLHVLGVSHKSGPIA